MAFKFHSKSSDFGFFVDGAGIKVIDGIKFPTTTSRRIDFENHYFETNDEKLASKIRELSCFGVYVWEITGAPKGTVSGKAENPEKSNKDKVEKRVDE